MSNKARWQIVIALAIVSITFLPYWFLGENSIFEAHDNLDSDVVWFSITAESGRLLSFSNNEVIEQYMNGLPRNSLMPGLNIISLLFYLFSPFWAFLFNLTIVRLVAFFSMFIFLRDYVTGKKEYLWLSLGVSVCFAFLPYWGVHSGLGISGLPLIAWSFLNLKTENRITTSYAVLALFPFYGSLIYTGVFYLIIVGVLWLWGFIKTKRLAPAMLIGMLIHTISYVIAELNLFIQLIGGGMVSHRTEKAEVGLNMGDAFSAGLDLLLEGQYHAPTLSEPVLVTICSLAFAFAIGLFIKNKRNHSIKPIIILSSMLMLASLFYGFWRLQAVVDIVHSVPLLKVIQWDRFHWLAPFLWFALFAYSLRLFLEYFNTGWIKLICGLAVVAQLYHSHSVNKILRTNESLVLGLEVNDTRPTFKQYYAQDLFSEMENFIGKPKSDYRVISVGLAPEIAAFSGFYVLDSYQRNYPLKYKHEFREVIIDELNRNQELKEYFDNWGSRCYAFSSELGTNYLWNKESNKHIETLKFDFLKLHEMGCDYLISSVPIKVENNPSLNLIEVFQNQDSYWRLYLYEIIL